jgi:hypothetical protein
MLASCSEERANRWMLADKFPTFFHHEINLVIGSESLNQAFPAPSAPRIRFV